MVRGEALAGGSEEASPESGRRARDTEQAPQVFPAEEAGRHPRGAQNTRTAHGVVTGTVAMAVCVRACVCVLTRAHVCFPEWDGISTEKALPASPHSQSILSWFCFLDSWSLQELTWVPVASNHCSYSQRCRGQSSEPLTLQAAGLRAPLDSLSFLRNVRFPLKA